MLYAVSSEIGKGATGYLYSHQAWCRIITRWFSFKVEPNRREFCGSELLFGDTPFGWIPPLSRSPSQVDQWIQILTM